MSRPGSSAGDNLLSNEETLAQTAPAGKISALGLNPNRPDVVFSVAGKCEMLLCPSTWSYPEKKSHKVLLCECPVLYRNSEPGSQR